MSDIGTFIAKLLLFILFFASFIFGIRGLIVAVKNNKKLSEILKKIFFIVLPIVLLFSMYYSGTYRKAPLNEKELNEIAAVIKGFENEKGDEFFSNEITFSSGVIYDKGVNTVGQCTIYTTELQAYDIDRFMYKQFKRSYKTDAGDFECSPICSDRGGAFLHNGYAADIRYRDTNGKIYIIEYKINRVVDLLLGTLYAPPVFGISDISGLLEKATPTSEAAAFETAKAYINENYPECSDYYNELLEVSEYNAALKSGDGAGTFYTPYNKAVFQAIDEKYNDKSVVIYCDNESFEDATTAVLIITEPDTGEILEVIEP